MMILQVTINGSVTPNAWLSGRRLAGPLQPELGWDLPLAPAADASD